jgi:hypothetical protein
MANVKISQLPTVNPVDSTTIFLVSSNTTGTLMSYNATITNVANAVLSNIGSNSKVNIIQNGNVTITSNSSYNWTFDVNGNLTLPANTFGLNYANGSRASAPLVDITNTNGLTTTYYPTFVENRTLGQVVRADVDLSYRTDTNTLTVGNLSISGGINVTGTLTAGNVYANSGTIGASLLTGTLTTAAQPNITSVGTLTSLTVTGNTISGNVYANSGTVRGSLLTGTLTTAAQPNITSVGTLTSLSVTGNVTANNFIGTLQKSVTGSGTTELVRGTMATNDLFRIMIGGTGVDSGYVELATADNGDEPIYVRQYSGDFASLTRTLTLLDANGNSSFPNNVSITGNITANNLGNISSLNLDGNSSNVLYGNGVFSATAIPYGDSNVTSLLANFGSNNILTTGDITANNFSGNITITGNVTGTSPNVTLVAGSYSYTFDNAGIVTFPTVGGDEGGEINLGIPASNTSLITAVKFDVYQDRIRFFDGSTKGVYIDLSQAGSGVGTLLNNRVAALVNAGSFVTMDNIKATVTTSGNRGLSLATVSGSFTYSIGATYGAGTGTGAAVTTDTLTTTPTASIFGWGFTAIGDISTYVLTDTTNSRCYRITLQIGAGYSNNSIIIERLI